MSEHEHLTGSFGSGYTGPMSESGVDIQERPRSIPNKTLLERLDDARAQSRPDGPTEPQVWESTFESQGRKDAWIAEREKKIFRETSENEKPPNIPKHVLRKETSWEKFGWTEPERVSVKKRLDEVFEYADTFHLNLHTADGRKRYENMVNNTMDILLASGKTPQEILAELNKGKLKKGYDLVKADIEVSRRAIGESKKEAWAQIYALTDIIGSDKNQDYLYRFVYTDQFRDELKAIYKREKPLNLYELAWQITAADQKHEDNFGVSGKYPVLEMRVDKDSDGRTHGRYVVNQANFIRWMRERIMHWQDQEPDEYVDYFSKVQLDKDYSPVTLGAIINDAALYFTDETGQYFGDLAKQTLLEPWILLEIRKYHIIYKGVMSSDKELVKQMGEMFSKNKFTKDAAGKNMAYYLSTLALDFGERNGDNTLGGAWNTMFLAYYNLGDYKKLEETLGKDSSFFTREGFEKAIEQVIKDKLDNTYTLSSGTETLLGDGLKNFEDAFSTKDANGKVIKTNTVQNKDAFIKLVNYFSTMGPNNKTKHVIEEALKNTVAEQYDFVSKEGNTDEKDEFSLKLGALIAEAHTLFTGAAAKNDFNAAGFNALSKLHNLENYRRKMATEARGNAMGNPFTVAQFKMLAVDWARATRVSEAQKSDGLDKDGKPIMRTKTYLEVMEEMRALDQQFGERRKALNDQLNQIQAEFGADSEKAKAKEREIAALNVAYKRTAGQLEFKENTMVNYVANHLDRARQVNEQIMGAAQIDFEKLAKYDPLTQIMSFDRAAFQEQIQEKFNKQLRYMVATYGELNMAMPVRASVFKGRTGDNDEWRYETIPLGEAMFGYEMLNIPQFRMLARDAEGKEIKGKYVVKNGRYVIDYNKVGSKDELTLAWKQFALMKIGADLWSHIDKHSRDPKYSIAYFRKVIEAIESIPAEIAVDEYNMKDAYVAKNLFSKEQMQWFKKLSKTTNFRLLLRGLKNDQKSKVDAGGIWDSMSLLLNVVFRGY